jgi:hypothetical protein
VSRCAVAHGSESCAGTIENASAYVVTVITVVPSRALALVSAYVADLSGHTAVTHMRLAPGAAGELRAAGARRAAGDLASARVSA